MWFPISTGTGGSGGGSGLKVVGSGTKPTTAEPGTIWVNDASYDGADLFIVPAGIAFTEHSGKSVVLTLSKVSQEPYSSFREVADGLWLNISVVCKLNGNLLSIFPTNGWDVRIADGSWLKG